MRSNLPAAPAETGRLATKVAIVCGVGAALLGASIVLGGVTDSSALLTWGRNRPTAMPIAGLAVMLCGVGLTGDRLVRAVSAGIAVAVMAAIGFIMATGWAYPQRGWLLDGLAPARSLDRSLPSPATVICLATLGVAVALSRRAPRVAQGLAVAPMLAGTLAVLSFLYGDTSDAIDSSVIPDVWMSAPLAAGLVAGAVGVFARTSEWGVMAFLTGGSPGRRTIRRLFPLALIGQALAAGLGLAVGLSDRVGDARATAMLVLAMSVGTTLIAFNAVRWVDRFSVAAAQREAGAARLVVTERSLGVAEFAQSLAGVESVEEVRRRVAEDAAGVVGSHTAAVATLPGSDPAATGATPALAEAIRLAQPVLLESADDYRARYPGTDPEGESVGGALAVMPLASRPGSSPEALSVAWGHPVQFDESLTASLATLSGIVAQSLDRARLREATAADARRNAAMARLAGAMTGAPSVDEVIGLVLSQVAAPLDAWGGVVGLVDPAANAVRRHFGSGVEPGFARSFELEPLDSPVPLVEAIRRGETLLFADPDAMASIPDRSRLALEAAGCQACAALPLRDATGVAFGSIMVAWAGPVDFDEPMTTMMATVSRIVAQSIDRARLSDEAVRLRDESDRLASFAESMAHSATVGDVVANILDRLPPALGCVDSGIAIVDRRSGVIRRYFGVDFNQRVAQAQAVEPIDLAADPMADAARNGATWWHPNRAAVAATHPHMLDLFDASGHAAGSVTPLRGRAGELVGSMMLAWDHEVVFDDALTTRVRTVTDLVAQTIERASLGDELRRDNERAEALAALARRLTLAAAASEVAAAAVEDLPTLLDASSVVLRVPDRSGADAGRAEGVPPLPVGASLVGPVAVGEVPLVTLDEVPLGMLRIEWDQPDARQGGPEPLLATIGELFTVTLERLRLAAAEHQLIEDLQRRALQVPPPLDGLRVAARYLPARSEVGMGGDWFQGLALDGGRLGLIVGDVVGHGAAAAGDMMQLSGVLRTLLRVGTPLGELLGFVREAVAPLEIMGSIVVCEIDPAAAVLRYVSAGHPPLVLRRPDGAIAVLMEGRGRLVGVPGPDGEATTVAFEPGSTLVAFTDGLLERRGEHLDVGLGRLCDALASSCRLDVERQVDELVAQCTAGHFVEDDIAVVVVRAEHGGAGRVCAHET